MSSAKSQDAISIFNNKAQRTMKISLLYTNRKRENRNTVSFTMSYEHEIIIKLTEQVLKITKYSRKK